MTGTHPPLKLQTVADGRLHATAYRTVYAEGRPGEFRRLGRLPVPATGRAGLEYRCKTTRPWKSVAARVVGRFPTVNVWRTSGGTLVGSAVRWLFASTDGGETWDVTRHLPASSGPTGVLPTALCEHDGSLYVGEYPLDTSVTPRVLRSDDAGLTWEPLFALPAVRHVHAIKSDPYTGDLWMTTGDVGDGCRIGRIRDGTFDVVGAGGQDWRAVEPVFTPDAVLWGVDSVYRETNPIYLLPRTETGEEDPGVEQVASVDSSVYYGTSLAVDGDHWVVFSTAVEPGTDRTAPADRQVVHTGRATVLTASSASDYRSWHDVVAYDRRAALSDAALVRNLLPASNAYVFLAADDDRGLFVNPYNTATNDGTIRRFPPAYFSHSA